jgi:hypothetical protein
MAVNVGDAILSLIADSTQLDKSLESVPAKSKAAFTPAQEDVIALKSRITQLETELKELALQFENTGRRTSHSMGEAKGEIALLGEATGVKLPRHVRGFVASLSGVGELLTAAFSATAVFFLIDALVQGAEKLSDFISETFIYSEATKKADEELGKLNENLNKANEQMRAAKLALEEFGKTASDKAAVQIRELNKELTINNAKVDANTAAFKRAQEEVARAEKFHAIGESLGFVGSVLEGATRKLEHFAFQLHLTGKDAPQELEAARKELEKFGVQAKINADDQKRLNAEIALKAKEAVARKLKRRSNSPTSERSSRRAELSFTSLKTSSSSSRPRTTALESRRARAYRRKTLSIRSTSPAYSGAALCCARDPSASPEARKQVNAEIEQLQNAHAKKMIDSEAAIVEGIQKLPLGAWSPWTSSAMRRTPQSVSRGRCFRLERLSTSSVRRARQLTRRK